MDVPWTPIPKCLVSLVKDGKLKQIDVFVFLAIFSHKNNKTGLCFPSTPTLAKETGFVRATISASIKRLKGCPIIRTSHQPGCPNFYEVVQLDGQEVSNPTDTNKIKEQDKYITRGENQKISSESAVSVPSKKSADVSESLRSKRKKLEELRATLIRQKIIHV